MPYSADRWCAAVLLLFCGIAASLTLDLPRTGTGTELGPDFFPWLMIGGIALFSAVLLVRARARGSAPAVGAELSPSLLAKMGLFTLLMLIYATLYTTAGYLLSSAVFFIVAMFVLGERRLLPAVVWPAAIILAVYFGFTKIMQVYLP